MMKMLFLIFAAVNGSLAVYLAWTARKTWKYLHTGMRVLDVCVVVLNVLCCAMNVLRALC